MGESDYALLTQISAIVSIPLSALVIITVLLFPALIRDRIFMELITWISVCDIMGNFPYLSTSYPANGTIVCSFEGYCNQFFYPVSWMLTAALAFLLWGLVVHQQLLLTRLQVHLICWGLPLLISLLILITNPYGTPSGTSGKEVCGTGGSTVSGTMWHKGAYIGLCIICCAPMIGWSLHLLFLAHKYPEEAQLPVFRLVRQVLFYYPVALVLCWSLHIVATFLEIKNVELIGSIGNALKILNGGANTIIFLINSPEARSRWSSLLFGQSNRNISSTLLPLEDFPDDVKLVEKLRTQSLEAAVPTIPELAMRDSFISTRFNSNSRSDA